MWVDWVYGLMDGTARKCEFEGARRQKDVDLQIDVRLRRIPKPRSAAIPETSAVVSTQAGSPTPRSILVCQSTTLRGKAEITCGPSAWEPPMFSG